jgi:hypothetical protein
LTSSETNRTARLEGLIYIKLWKTTSLTIAGIALSFSASHAAQYDVDFKLNTAGSYKALQYNVGYAGAGATFDGSADLVSCTSNAATGAIAAFNDKDSSSTLVSGFMNSSSITGPIVLATCVFTAASAPTSGQFTITITDFDAGSSPSISVSRVWNSPGLMDTPEALKESAGESDGKGKVFA